MVQTSKKHHYLPQFYVAGFTNKEGNVFVLEHETGVVNKQSKNGTFHKRKFYTVDFSKYPKRNPESAQRIKESLGIENVDTSNVKEYPDMIEDLLGESETISAPIIKKLIAKEKLTSTERIELSTFIAFMYTRNPTFHEFVTGVEKKMTEKEVQHIFSSKEKIKELYKKMHEEDGYDKKINIDELFKFVQEKRYGINIPKESNIEVMLMGATIIDRILYNKTWFVVEAPTKTSFVSNDNPVFLDHPRLYEKSAYGVGFETPGVKVVFPLSKECLLIMKNTSEGAITIHDKVDKKKTKELNKMIFARSGDYVFGRDEALVLSLKKMFIKA